MLKLSLGFPQTEKPNTKTGMHFFWGGGVSLKEKWSQEGRSLEISSHILHLD